MSHQSEIASQNVGQQCHLGIYHFSVHLCQPLTNSILLIPRARALYPLFLHKLRALDFSCLSSTDWGLICCRSCLSINKPDHLHCQSCLEHTSLYLYTCTVLRQQSWPSSLSVLNILVCTISVLLNINSLKLKTCTVLLQQSWPSSLSGLAAAFLQRSRNSRNADLPMGISRQ